MLTDLLRQISKDVAQTEGKNFKVVEGLLRTATRSQSGRRFELPERRTTGKKNSVEIFDPSSGVPRLMNSNDL